MSNHLVWAWNTQTQNRNNATFKFVICCHTHKWRGNLAHKFFSWFLDSKKICYALFDTYSYTHMNAYRLQLTKALHTFKDSFVFNVILSLNNQTTKPTIKKHKAEPPDWWYIVVQNPHQLKCRPLTCTYMILFCCQTSIQDRQMKVWCTRHLATEENFPQRKMENLNFCTWVRNKKKMQHIFQIFVLQHIPDTYGISEKLRRKGMPKFCGISNTTCGTIPCNTSACHTQHVRFCWKIFYI